MICPRESFEVSVGKTSPPPSRTIHLHSPHVPPPPQAEGKNIFCSANALSNLPPMGTETDFSSSSLIVILAEPEATNFDLANRIRSTNAITMIINIKTPKRTKFIPLIKTSL